VNKEETEEKGIDLTVYEDCVSPGELIATWKAENLCFRCLLFNVCHASIALQNLHESLIVVSRCRTFTSGEI
jgi:hypothetical protein